MREAHAIDSRLPMEFGGVEDPITDEERHAMARRCTEELGMTMPTVIDRVDDEVAIAYQAWPERLYLIDGDGNVAFRCGPGPFGFDPNGLETAIRDALGLSTSSRP